ncbi:uncharacterized protein TNCV_3336571 [Trichonephila clavipes]|nr:uncharacterized protein TNCV_3336571 [Trichonephila clavipes]
MKPPPKGRMERKRKGYLLRKSVSFDIPQQPQKKTPKITCTCDNATSSSRSYDLQTQTITFGEEPKQHKKFSYSSIIKKLSSSPPTDNKVNPKPFDMDADLEFYPVDDHPSPSTFTAWDAFLSGNQAFFREPPSDFSYMDVIPEEEDDLEALLESDTDDTGSSVSTVVDRFSRTSTANSSFSERGPRTDAAPFDLQKVLSPFERLEKELDAHQGQKEDDRLPRKNEIQRGPIVVITNSSSCEDVHSEADDLDKTLVTSPPNHDSQKQEDKKIESTSQSEKTLPKDENACTNSEKPFEANVVPSVPVRTKLVNGIKSAEKPPAKRLKSDKTIPIIPPPSTPKKSYPTPNIPPRMSLHSPARRTRSDPGTPDQPSRIPRPISSANRTTPPTPGTRGGPKSLKNPKSNISKKITVESPKSNSTSNQSDFNIEQSITSPKNIDNSFGENESKVDMTEAMNSVLAETISCTSDEQRTVFPDFSEFEEGKITNGPMNLRSETVENGVDYNLHHANGLTETVVEETNSNPFCQEETNPFRVSTESKNPFLNSSNPFEEACSEVTPALQPKAQISAAVKAPPIPESGYGHELVVDLSWIQVPMPRRPSMLMQADAAAQSPPVVW